MPSAAAPDAVSAALPLLVDVCSAIRPEVWVRCSRSPYDLQWHLPGISKACKACKADHRPNAAVSAFWHDCHGCGTIPFLAESMSRSKVC